jgi:hypothetical protein
MLASNTPATSEVESPQENGSNGWTENRKGPVRGSGDLSVPKAVSYSQPRFVLIRADNAASFSVAACGTLPLCHQSVSV